MGQPVNHFREEETRFDATKRLPRVWYARDARTVARALLGCYVVHELPTGTRVARIVETEAYCGPSDRACHARVGLTERTRTLLGQEGDAYVFLVYGMHDCFNVTCLGPGRGHAVLVRAAEVASGMDEASRLDGPGRFARSMSITRALDGHDLERPPLYLCARARRPAIVTTPRVGVAYAGPWADRPWRFLDATSPSLSRPPRNAIGRGEILPTRRQSETMASAPKTSRSSTTGALRGRPRAPEER